MNELTSAFPAPVWPDRFAVEPSRLSIGLWGETEGDIAAAYCADTLPKAQAFLHHGQHFVNTGSCPVCTAPDNWEEAARCYPLIPEQDYRGPERRPYSYEGERVKFQGQPHRLGPEVLFVCRERTIEEWADLLRHEYAHGGYFAAGKTYAEVLWYFQGHQRTAKNRRAAMQQELEQTDLPTTQEEMRSLLLLRATPPLPDRRGSQLELAF